MFTLAAYQYLPVALVAVGLVGVTLAARKLPGGASGLWGRALKRMAIYMAVILPLLAGALILERRAGVCTGRTLTILFGAFYVIMGIWRPMWFWNHPGSLRCRAAIGDQWAVVFFLLFGFVFVLLGLSGSAIVGHATCSAHQAA